MYVYIASAYTEHPDGKQAAVLQQLQAAERLMYVSQGQLVPIVPLLSHFWNIVSPHSYDFWLDYDLKLVELCDVLLRLPGKSVGADREEARAKELGLLVYYSLGDLPEELCGEYYDGL